MAACGRTPWARPSLLLAFASCASAPLPEALLPYEDAARFLLPGFRTVALSTHEFEDPAPNRQMFFRRAFCGRDFERPGGVGIGSYRGIEVMDFGPAGLGGARPDAAPAASFAGVDVFHTHSRHRDGNVVDEWFAWVDDRFSVSSHHRELLERSLARGAELTTLLQPFAALSDLPGDATGAVCLLARPEDQTYWGEAGADRDDGRRAVPGEPARVRPSRTAPGRVPGVRRPRFVTGDDAPRRMVVDRAPLPAGPANAGGAGVEWPGHLALTSASTRRTHAAR